MAVRVGYIADQFAQVGKRAIAGHHCRFQFMTRMMISNKNSPERLGSCFMPMSSMISKSG